MDKKDSYPYERKPETPEPTGAQDPRSPTPGPQGADLPPTRARLSQKVRQIVDQTPKLRPEKVANLKEAVRQGTYRINARHLANILIAKLFTER